MVYLFTENQLVTQIGHVVLKKEDQLVTTWYILEKKLVSWYSKRQPTISRSSTEAKYKSVANAVAEVLWIQSLLSEIHLPLNSSPNLWRDNISSTYLETNPVFHARTKRIEIIFILCVNRLMLKI